MPTETSKPTCTGLVLKTPQGDRKAMRLQVIRFKGKQMDIQAVMDKVCTYTGVKVTAVNRASWAFQSIRLVF